MFVELAPTPAAPASPPDLPPTPEPVDAAPPSQPPPKPVTQAEPEPAVPATPAAAKPKVDTQKAKPEPDPVKEKPAEMPPQEKSATVARASTADSQAKAPQQGQPAVNANAKAIPHWQNQLMAKLNQAKRYPYRARRMRQEGIVYIEFIMDRNGKVISKALKQTSGHHLLDKETLALLERAQPLPPPPQEMTGTTVELVVPIRFSLN